MSAPVTLRERDYAQMLPETAPDANKYSRGTVAIIGGSSEYPGAPIMAARAASRCGAGYVRIVAPAGAAQVARHHLLSIPVSACTASGAGTLSADSVAQVQVAIAKSNVLVIGPGMGVCDASYRFLYGLLELLDECDDSRPIVFDADALTIISQHPELLTMRTHDTNVLTPHEGEAARLLGRRVTDRLEDARALAHEFRSTVILKGPETLIVHPDGRARLNTCAGPELAKAGTGDVLAGMVGSLMAQRLDVFDACSLGVFLHGYTAQMTADELSVNACMPEDIIETIGSAIMRLGSVTGT